MLDPVATPLQVQLDEITASTRALVPPDRLIRLEQLIDSLRSTGIEDALLTAGTAPLFALKSATGRTVHLKDLLSLGPVVLKFFRGRWDAYDMTELELWEGLLPTLRRLRTIFVAISPQTMRQNAFTADRHHLSFPLLADPACAVAAQYGVSYVVPPPDRVYFRSILVNIPFLNGEESWQLPLPATYALSPGGQICFAQGFADHRRRPDPHAVIDLLRTFSSVDRDGH